MNAIAFTLNLGPRASFEDIYGAFRDIDTTIGVAAFEAEVAIGLPPRPYPTTSGYRVEVQRLSYENPLEVVLTVGAATGPTLALLVLLRDWKSNRRMSSTEADRQEAITEALKDELAEHGYDATKKFLFDDEKANDHSQGRYWRLPMRSALIRIANALVDAREVPPSKPGSN